MNKENIQPPSTQPHEKAVEESRSIRSIFISRARTKDGRIVSHLRWWVSLLLSLGLAIGTWNPTGHHFIHYIASSNPMEGFKPFYILTMIALWILALKAIYQSLRWYGAMITALIIAAFVYGLSQKGLVDPSNITTLGWVGTIGMGLIIWIGMNASVAWKKMTGIYTTDIAEDG